MQGMEAELLLRMAAIIDNATDGIITIDTKGVVESANKAACFIFGCEEGGMIGKNIKYYMPSPYHEEHDGYIANYLNTGIKKIIGIGRTVKGLRKDGTEFPLRLAVSEVRLPDRVIFTGIVHDISEVAKSQEEIYKLNKDLIKAKDALEIKVDERTEHLAEALNKILANNKKLELEITQRQHIEKRLREREQEIQDSLLRERELGELKSRFLSMASHEFRTPLSGILSSAEILEMHESKLGHTGMEKHILRIKSSVSQLIGILNDILSLSRLDEGKLQVNKEYFEFDGFFAEVREEMQQLCKKGQHIIYQNKPGDDLIYTDKKLLKNILLNLMSNAIKYSQEGKPIECYMKLSESKLNLKIRDHGIGIPQKDQPYLFGNFFRASNVENVQGTGLGLAIVRRYLDVLRGQIHFKSEEGVGTEIEFSIPITA